MRRRFRILAGTEEIPEPPEYEVGVDFGGKDYTTFTTRDVGRETTLTLASNPSLQIGDIVSITGASQNNNGSYQIVSVSHSDQSTVTVVPV